MPPAASLSGLTLRVRDQERALAFYRDLLGLEASATDGTVRLRPAGGDFTLRLEVDPGAPPGPAHSLGLYHFALLLPTRAALGAVLRVLAEARWAVDGASDHIVSEALYLRDPEGNGIELAWDRPRKEWKYTNGQLTMVSDMLDIDTLMATAPAAAGLAPGTRLGHVHLSVDDLARGEGFYAGGLGLTVTQRSYPGALFLAAGDYHHHLGMNIWGARRPAPPGAPGLVAYAWQVPPGTMSALAAHLDEQQIPYRSSPDALTVGDPVGITVSLAETGRR